MIYPAGLQRNATTREHFTLQCNTKAVLQPTRLTTMRPAYKLCCGKKDAKDPLPKVNDTLKVNLGTNKIEGFYTFEIGKQVSRM